MPTDDKLFGKGRIREDGSVIHPIYLYQVKSPEEWRLGLLQLVTALLPMNRACPLVPR